MSCGLSWKDELGQLVLAQEFDPGVRLCDHWWALELKRLTELEAGNHAVVPNYEGVVVQKCLVHVFNRY